jgi:predicted protein tyrosine phosphatase
MDTNRDTPEGAARTIETLPPLFISSKNRAKETARREKVKHILSCLDPTDRLVTPSFIDPARHLTLKMDDSENPDDIYAPTLDDVIKVDHWVASVPPDARLLIHCFQGVSRSTAMTLGLLCQRSDPVAAIARLKVIRPEATPNRLIVRLWDGYLKLDGRLVEAARVLPPPAWTLPLHLR